ncbi:hypothetical protein LIER_39921 [Lithospermum erythrorhizon]|uniref:LOB domain-containing protein n=1 Tax=Lithospermum erythrorhizon TaxID=34254 RepID=A0AAV3QPH2_LITER
MTVKGGSSPACAACKYQRRKCSSECILAPYFPASQHKVFQNVHRLYGVRKIMNLLKDLPTDELREDAMISIKYESDMRAKFPVNGCTFVISKLEKQYLQAAQELKYVHEQLKHYKDQFLNCQIADPVGVLQFGVTSNNCIDGQFSDSDTNEQMDFMMMNSNHPNYIQFYEFGNVNNSNNTNNNNVVLGLDTIPTSCDLENNDNHHTSVPIQAPLVDLGVFNNHQEREASQQCEDRYVLQSIG